MNRRAFREVQKIGEDGKPYLTVEEYEEDIKLDQKLLEKHIDNHLRCACLRSAPIVKDAFIAQNTLARMLWGDDESTWPPSYSWETFREENMWICELRARELDPDQSKWVRYPGREEVPNEIDR